MYHVLSGYRYTFVTLLLGLQRDIFGCYTSLVSYCNLSIVFHGRIRALLCPISKVSVDTTTLSISSYFYSSTLQTTIHLYQNHVFPKYTPCSHHSSSNLYHRCSQLSSPHGKSHILLNCLSRICTRLASSAGRIVPSQLPHQSRFRCNKQKRHVYRVRRALRIIRMSIGDLLPHWLPNHSLWTSRCLCLQHR
jgi:hypothetical protein